MPQSIEKDRILAGRRKGFRILSFTFRTRDIFTASFRHALYLKRYITLLFYGYHIRSNSFRMYSARNSAHALHARNQHASIGTHSEDDI